MARVGLLGGTFNPPHLAHLACARQAREQLGLDRVELVVAARPPHKEIPADPGIEHRLAMCRLAAAAADRLSVCELEVGRAGPSYTITTLRQIKANRPGDELTVILGADMAFSLPAWEEPEEILELAELAVAERPGMRREAVLEQLGRLRSGRAPVFLEMEELDVSSTLVRDEARAGRPIRHLAPDQVVDYIEQRRLYA